MTKIRQYSFTPRTDMTTTGIFSIRTFADEVTSCEQLLNGLAVQLNAATIAAAATVLSVIVASRC
jgi:hypothetical protein